jgi:tripartite-type tricarboxylate transporter receptor subunit TctC
MWGFMAGLIPQVRAGTLRAVAAGGRERSAVLPDVPTFTEAGVPGYEAVS